MTKSCGQCKWFAARLPGDKDLCKFPLPIWLLDHVFSTSHGRLANFVRDSSGADCPTFELRRN